MHHCQHRQLVSEHCRFFHREAVWPGGGGGLVGGIVLDMLLLTSVHIVMTVWFTFRTCEVVSVKKNRKQPAR